MPITPDLPQAEAAIVEQTNEFRASQQLAALKSEPLLAEAARAYARFLAASTLFTHEADGRRPVDRIKAAGYQPCAVAENLAWHSDARGFETLQLARANVLGWKGSPGHRKNMLMQHAVDTGVAIVKARTEEKYFAVQLFGRPMSLQYSFDIVNATGRTVGYSISGQEKLIEPRIIRTHTECDPATLEFQLKPGGLLTKAVTARFQAQAGQVFRLGGAKDGPITVEVGSK